MSSPASRWWRIVGAVCLGLASPPVVSHAATKFEGKLVDIGPNWITIDDGQPRQFSHSTDRRSLNGGAALTITGFIPIENLAPNTPVNLFGFVEPGETDLSTWYLIAYPFWQPPMQERQLLGIGDDGRKRWSMILWGTVASAKPFKVALANVPARQATQAGKGGSQPTQPLWQPGAVLTLDPQKMSILKGSGGAPKFPAGNVEIDLGNDLSFAHKGAKVTLSPDKNNPTQATYIRIERTEPLPLGKLKR